MYSTKIVKVETGLLNSSQVENYLSTCLLARGNTSTCHPPSSNVSQLFFYFSVGFVLGFGYPSSIFLLVQDVSYPSSYFLL